MSFSFQIKVASREFHIYKNTTREDVKICQEISVQLETNAGSTKIDPYCCAIKPWSLENWRQSVIYQGRFQGIYFYIKEEGGRIDGSVLSTRYRPSPIHIGGL